MSIAPTDGSTATMLTEIAEARQRQALEHYRLIRAHLEQDVPLARVARDAELPLRTAQRWVNRYRQFGLAGLLRSGRADNGKRRRISDDLRRVSRYKSRPLAPSRTSRSCDRARPGTASLSHRI
jgi:hypothetical protein